MIDEIWVPSWVHASVGGLVLLTTLLATVILAWRAWRRQPIGAIGHGSMILAQMVLMIQALIGIKLLDQGLGPLQLYIHYVGGLAPLMFMLVYYWLPERLKKARWLPASLALAAFLFALMAFTIGQSYVAGGSGA